MQSSAQGTNEVQSNQPNPMATDGPGGDSGSLSIASNDNRKVSREDIELVRSQAMLKLLDFSDGIPLQGQSRLLLTN